MERWLRATRTAVLALVVPATLASCGGGGGGSIRLFFGTNGDGGCDRIVVDVDLAAAGAVLSRRDDQSADCVLGALLDTAGCQIDVEELDDGDTLRVTIDDCTIPPVSALFDCGFSEADLSEFDDEAVADCECESPGCDQTPPVCVSGDDDPRSCEDCGNDRDDDLNGLADCDDPNCEHAAVCAGTPTTTTLPDVTTTTVTDTTTTTLALLDCDVTTRLMDDVTVGSLEWLTDFGASAGSFAGSGAGVDCTVLTDQTLSAVNEHSGDPVLESGLVSLAGIDGPIDLLRCRWQGTAAPDAEDFVVSAVEAATVDLVLLPDPEIAVSDIDCGGPGTTTTTTLDETTTTTLTNTTTSKVAFRLTSASTTLGALQLLVDYGSAPGSFDGQGASVKCTFQVPDTLTARNDDDDGRELSLGFISLDGITAPVDLAQCDFTGSVPVASDFHVTVADAAGVESEPATASVSVEVVTTP